MGKNVSPRAVVHVGTATHRQLLRASALTRHTMGETVEVLVERYCGVLVAEWLAEQAEAKRQREKAREEAREVAMRGDTRAPARR